MKSIFNDSIAEIEKRRLSKYSEYYENLTIPTITFSIKDIIEKDNETK